jgi:N6-L-threonylcarbamoyladenine synthase
MALVKPLPYFYCVEWQAMSADLLVLGIETSCDETAAAVLRGDRTVLAERLLSQWGEHAPYGGVVPEIAARAHLNHLDRLVAEVMGEAKLGFHQLSAVAATGGPGLIGGIMVGVMTAKAIAAVHQLPFLAINHLEAHALSPRLSDDLAFPYLLLLVSGGHCQVLVTEGVGRYVRLGGTVDDAAGEAFDKVAKMLNLGYPGGPAVERLAATGTPGRFRLPRPMKGREGADFSFAGLKTAVRQVVLALPGSRATERDAADLCRDFQDAVAEIVVDRTANAVALFRRGWPKGRALVVAGGVAANRRLRAVLADLARASGLDFVAPPMRFCTDNAAMVAWAGIERLRLGQRDALDFAPRPRWPLAEPAPQPAPASAA